MPGNRWSAVKEGARGGTMGSATVDVERRPLYTIEREL
jgi:hypothetical protein